MRSPLEALARLLPDAVDRAVGIDLAGRGRAGRDPSTDAELILLCREGDQRAWEALVRRYGRLVHGIAWRAGLSFADCEDVMQTVFLKAYRSLDLLDRPESVGFWLSTMARREAWKAKDRIARPGRGAGRAPAGTVMPADALPELASADPLPDEEMERAQRLALVHSGLNRLDARCRTLLEELFFRDPAPSYDQSAVNLRLPRGSLGPARSRCLAKLGGILRGLGFR